MVQLTTSIGLDNALAPNRPQAIIWTNTNPIIRRIYAALGRDELKSLFTNDLNNIGEKCFPIAACVIDIRAWALRPILQTFYELLVKILWKFFQL